MTTFYTRCLQELPKLKMSDVHRICRTTKAPASKLDKGFKLYAASYIHNYEVSNKDRLTGQVSVRALCYRSMRKSETAHSLSITLRDSSPVVLTHNQCSCVSGTVLCNHTVALLFQTAHYTELNMSVVPPVHSCTESEQQWHKPRTMGVKPGPSAPWSSPSLYQIGWCRLEEGVDSTEAWWGHYQIPACSELRRHGGAITRSLPVQSYGGILSVQH
nr:uncharacterized protein LOC117443882 [Pseudochaenichthys georgianus]